MQGLAKINRSAIISYNLYQLAGIFLLISICFPQIMLKLDKFSNLILLELPIIVN